MEALKKWVIKFESGALLAERKMKVTFLPSDAMKFESRASAGFFLKIHSQEICEVGLNPSVGEFEFWSSEAKKEMEHSLR